MAQHVCSCDLLDTHWQGRGTGCLKRVVLLKLYPAAERNQCEVYRAEWVGDLHWHMVVCLARLTVNERGLGGWVS